MKQLSAWLAVGLFACGNVTVKSPDGGGSADTTPPTLVSSTPAADASGVALMAPLQLVFDEPLDPASVTPEAFALGCWECSPVFTTPSYDDATRTVTLVPLIPLDPDVPYELMISSGLRDAAGNAFAGATVVFHTRKNSVTRFVNYNTSTGMPTGWTSWTLDAAGDIAASYGYNAPGPDAVWLTADDVISARQAWVTSGAKVVRTAYAAGADGKLGTADDVVSGRFETDNNSDGNPIAYWTYDGSGAVTQLVTQAWDGRWVTESDTHVAAGADGQWNTADDSISRVSKYEYDGRQRQVRQIDLDAGPDHRANTADDVILDYSSQVFDAHDRYGTRVLFTAFGVDGVAGTADDGAGPDGTWFTGDDIPESYSTNNYDTTAMTVSGATYESPGSDQAWMTADDVASSSYTSTYDAHWVHTGNTYFNASDVISGTTTYHHDSDGLETDNTDYTSAGSDGAWHTADDRAGWRYDFDDTH